MYFFRTKSNDHGIIIVSRNIVSIYKEGSSLIYTKQINGDYTSYEYKSKEDRDSDFDKLFNFLNSFQE